MPSTYCPNYPTAGLHTATAYAESSKILFPNVQWSNAPPCTTPSTVPVVYSSTATQGTAPLTVQEVIQQEFPRVAPTPVSMIEIDAKLAENDQIILRHKNLRTGLQSTKAAYASSINLAAEVAKTDQAILRHQTLLEGLQNAEAAYVESIDLSKTDDFEAEVTSTNTDGRPIYTCKACNHSTINKTNFNIHLKAQRHSKNNKIWQMNKKLARIEASKYNPIEANASAEKTRKIFMDFAQHVARAAAEAAEIRKNSLVNSHSKKAKAIQKEQSNKWKDLEQDPKWDVISNLLINNMEQLTPTLNPVGRSTPTPIPSRRTTTTPVTDMDATSAAMESLGIQQERVQLQEQCQPSTEKDSWNKDAPKDSELEAFDSFKEAVKIIRICFHPEPRNIA